MKHNIIVLCQLFAALADKYSYRYKKRHSTDLLLRKVLKEPPSNIPKNEPFIQPPQCMPDEYKCDDSVIAYQNFYIGEKAHFSKWKRRERPKWYLT